MVHFRRQGTDRACIESLTLDMAYIACIRALESREIVERGAQYFYYRLTSGAVEFPLKGQTLQYIEAVTGGIDSRKWVTPTSDNLRHKMSLWR